MITLKKREKKITDQGLHITVQFISDLFKSLNNHLFVQVSRQFSFKNAILSKNFRSDNRFLGDSEFLGDLGQLFANLGAGLSGSGVPKSS